MGLFSGWSGWPDKKISTINWPKFFIFQKFNPTQIEKKSNSTPILWFGLDKFGLFKFSGRMNTPKH